MWRLLLVYLVCFVVSLGLGAIDESTTDDEVIIYLIALSFIELLLLLVAVML